MKDEIQTCHNTGSRRRLIRNIESHKVIVLAVLYGGKDPEWIRKRVNA